MYNYSVHIYTLYLQFYFIINNNIQVTIFATVIQPSHWNVYKDKIIKNENTLIYNI